MKKLVSIILAVMLVLSLSATAFADGYNSNVKDRGFYDFDDNWWYDWYGTDGNDLYYFDEGELNEFTLPALFEDCDILVDCLDNMETRKLLNAFSQETGKVLVHAGVTGYTGQVTVIVPGKTSDLEGIYRYVKVPEGIPPSLGSMVSLIGSLEATQVVQIITGTGSPLVGKLAVVDLQNGSMEIIDLSS